MPCGRSGQAGRRGGVRQEAPAVRAPGLAGRLGSQREERRGGWRKARSAGEGVSPDRGLGRLHPRRAVPLMRLAVASGPRQEACKDRSSRGAAPTGWERRGPPIRISTPEQWVQLCSWLRSCHCDPASELFLSLPSTSSSHCCPPTLTSTLPMCPSSSCLARGAALVALAGLVCAQATNRSTWEAEAAIASPTAECEAYGYAPVDGGSCLERAVGSGGVGARWLDC